MKRGRLIKTVLISFVCCGCSSTPVRYYTLLPPLPARSELASGTCCRVQIKRVIIPPEVDRPELVTRSGDDQAVVLGNATWLAPLRDEIRGALTSQISLKLVEGAAIEPTARAEVPIVFVDVTRFESMPARYVLVSADWRIQRADSTKAASLACQTTVQVTVLNGISAIVQGYQQAVAKIADQIALDILNVRPSEKRRCPTD